MKAKLIVNDKEIEVEISEKDLKELTTANTRTGYERVCRYGTYYFENYNGSVAHYCETNNDVDIKIYRCANYYSSEIVAENNARADRLMRQLRRFAVEHRNKNIDWSKGCNKYFICFNHSLETINTDCMSHTQYLGQIYFDSNDTALQAINIFHDELIWYFTEYKDSI